MFAGCCSPSSCSTLPFDLRYRKALWVALFLSILKFVVELGMGAVDPAALAAGLAISGARTVLKQARMERQAIAVNAR